MAIPPEFPNMIDSCVLAVKIRFAEKSYKDKTGVKPTFTGLNLSLPRGNIYALLGPSGCGKTTLLRCVLGRQQFDKGTVTVFGHPPGSKKSGIPGPFVGYMAQETTVYLTMTIGEYLWYYGAIFGLSSAQISSKTTYFINLLKLPSKNTRTNTLSGGQLRRIQFAAALIHEPKLLILDEPTVGIEVTTKQSMWEYLVKLTKEGGTTVLLTTHYIEEARLADRVGMMHNGTMVEEDTTGNLLRKYNEATLEGVFLKICSGEHVEVVVDHLAISGVDDDLMANHQIETEKLPNVKNCNAITWHRLWPIFMKISVGLYRFPGALLTLLMIPFFQALLFRETLGTPIGGIPVIVVNQDIGQLGARYLSFLNPEIITQKPYQDYDVGLQAVRHGEATAILHIKPNFSSVFHKRYVDFSIVNAKLLESGTLNLKMDNSNLHIAKFAEYHMLETFQHFLNGTLRTAGINPLLVQPYIQINEDVLQLLVSPPRKHVMPGFSVQNAYFPAEAVSIFVIFMERHKGYMEPNLIAGVTPLEIILATLLFQAVLILVQNVGAVLITLSSFTGYSNGSVFLVYCILYVQGFGGTALGMFLSLTCDNILILLGLAVVLIFFSAATQGWLWPIEAMPTFYRYVCQCLPCTLSGRAVDVVIQRGWDLRYFAVYGAFLVSFLWIFIFLAISFWMFSRKK